jgi:hypothetical protein
VGLTGAQEQLTATGTLNDQVGDFVNKLNDDLRSGLKNEVAQLRANKNENDTRSTA